MRGRTKMVQKTTARCIMQTGACLSLCLCVFVCLCLRVLVCMCLCVFLFVRSSHHEGGWQMVQGEVGSGFSFWGRVCRGVVIGNSDTVAINTWTALVE